MSPTPSHLTPRAPFSSLLLSETWVRGNIRHNADVTMGMLTYLLSLLGVDERVMKESLPLTTIAEEAAQQGTVSRLYGEVSERLSG